MNNRIVNLDRANRVLMMLSRINRTIIRADSPDALYGEVCRIAVECGMFKFAWIGLVDSFSGGIRLMASYGDPCGEEDTLTASGGFADEVHQHGDLCIYNDLMTLPDSMDCRELVRRGFFAMAGLPLFEGDKAIGVFMLYTDETECFDATVVELLHEVTDDISFSLNHMLIEQRRLATESKLFYLAFYDPQTGLPNRALLEDRLPQLAKHGRLVLFDIRVQRMDKVVEIFGRLAMEEVLRTLASRLEDCRSDGGFLAHLAQDEFVLVSLELNDNKTIESFAQHLLRSLEEPIRLGDKEVFLHPSIGGAIYPLHEKDVTHLLRRARVAADRGNGEGGFRLYSAELDRGLEQRVQMEAELHRALERGEFELFYQPQLSLKSGTIIGVEALLHWRHPQRGLVPPGAFVPLLEECGLMPAVGAWALHEACRQAKQWQLQGLRGIRMAVNVSALQFRLVDLVDTVRQGLNNASLDAERLELELTESLILENVEQTIQAMHSLKALGVSLSLDDFGTGYSSLSYLRRYPVDRIKIDQSFIHDMMEHASSAALVRSILAMAHSLELKTIAEGVETVAQFDYLRKQLCDEMQGYLFSRPIAAGEVAEMLTDGRSLGLVENATSASHTVLIVDRDPRSLALSQRTLERESWHVLVATDAASGMALLAANEVGLVIAGMDISDTFNASFLHQVREMYPDCMRILLLAHADLQTVADAINQGEPYRVLLKPVNDELLREASRDAFRKYQGRVAERQSIAS